MAKRALLIGSQTGNLRGVYGDVRAVADGMAQRGFSAELCLGADATRQGILTRYESLIDAAEAGDAVFVYYSGHGGMAPNPDYRPASEGRRPAPPYYQFVVPVDIEESWPHDFRGITNVELSLLLNRLTQKTKNVTVVLDCCHAARMSRALDLTPKALPRIWFVSIEAHLKRLADQGFDLGLRDVESNPDAVRLVAAAPDQSAYEYTNAAGERRGLLTESFLQALDEVQGLKLTWHSLGTRVRERVLSIAPDQRPDIEGPSDRLLFELDTAQQTGILPVILLDGVPALQGGRLLGVHEGDEYAILPLGLERDAAENQIAHATVESVSGSTSRVRLEFCGAHTTVPAGAVALPVSTTLPRRPVRLTATGPERAKLSEGITASRFVRLADGDDPVEVLADVAIVGGQIDLRDRCGLPLLEPKPFSIPSVAETVSNLDRLARVQAVLNLRSGGGASALNTPVRIEWGRVVGGKPRPLAHSGELLFVGEPVYVRVANQGAKKIYGSIFDIGLSGKITLLTASEPSGVGVAPGQEYSYGHKEGVGWTGVKLGWASGVPKDAPRSETLVTIVSDIPQDLRGLEQRGVRGSGTSPLERMMEQIGYGGIRALEPSRGAADVRYAVEQISFLVDPNPAPTQDRGIFVIDDRPEPAFLLRIPEAGRELRARLAARLKDLIVHHTRPLSSTKIRVDAMVVTASEPGTPSDVSCRMQTARFSCIRDGDRLPLENLLVYCGPVAHFLDMAVWVSRDQEGSLSLPELFRTEYSSAEFRQAAQVLAGLSVPAPQASAVVGALGGGATLVSIGTRLLVNAVGTSIGLYRTSYLASERFGEGRHPAKGVMTAQDFSFSYEISAAD